VRVEPDRSATPAILIAGIGIAAAGSQLPIDLGPFHPATHAALELALTVESGRVTAAEARPGLMHRGAEKLFEVRDYPAVLALANRHDWLAPFAGELGVALAVESLLGISVPPRAVWIRMLLAELSRVSSHLAFLSALPTHPDSNTSPTFAWASRERVQQLLAAATGAHLHSMAVAIGGVRHDVTAQWLASVQTELPQLRNDVAHLAEAADLTSLRAVAPLGLAAALEFGVTGPMARAGGSTFDVRSAEPYLAYGEVADAGLLRIPSRAQGDAAARFELLLEETSMTLDLVHYCADRVASTPGPIGIRLPKVLRVPEGRTVSWTETPLGAATWLLDSHGDKVPWRLKLKAPSFAIMAAMSALLVGVDVSDLPLALSSCFFVVGDADR